MLFRSQYIVLHNFWMRGLTYGGKGEYTAALAALQEAMALSDRLGDKVISGKSNTVI